MTSLVAIASKQVQLQELVACVEHFDVTDFSLHLFINQGRISPDHVRALIEEVCPTPRLDVSAFDIDDKRAITDILGQQADVVALPLYRSSGFYRRVPMLRKRSRIVHVTDGLGDLFTMWELQRAVIAKTPTALMKGAFVIPQLRACRADFEFNLFHPKKSPYAKTSLGVGRFPMTSRKRRLIDNLLKTHQPGALVIDGFDLSAERIATAVGVKSFIATNRDGGISINGRTHLGDEVICAEEVLDVIRPDFVVGCPSTALAAAKCLHADLPVFCITTPEAVRIRGPRFNEVFQAYASRFGIEFAGTGDVQSQFDHVSKLIPKDVRACA